MAIINESKRDDLLQPYVEFLATKGINTNISQLKRYLLRKFVEEGGFRNLSLGSNFYLAGVARYYFNGDLTNGTLGAVDDKTDNWKEDVCTRLNELILILRNAYVDSVGETFEQPEDFGTLTLQKLLRKYGKKIDQSLGIVTKKEKKEDEDDGLNRDPHVGNGYTYEIIYSYNQARKYNKATEPGAWCITYGEHHYNGYVRNLGIHYVVFAKDGYENVPRVKEDEMWKGKKPQDTYGNSLICLLQSNKDGRPVYITSRWNHGANGISAEADHAYTPEEFFNIVGIDQSVLDNIFKIWSKNRTKVSRDNTSTIETKKQNLAILRDLKYKQMRMNGGESPDQVLGELRPIRVLYGNGKWNKSIALYSFNAPDGPERYVLVDRGKIIFESIRDTIYDYETFSNGRAVDSITWGWDKNCFNDLITIGGRGNDSIMLYSARFHKFVDVDGVIKFKHISYIYRYGGVSDILFYQVAQSGQQRALISMKSNQPLKLPNGSCWFEKVRFNGMAWERSNKVNVPIIKNDTHILDITYDSSSKEKYFYDIEGKTFVDIPEKKTKDGIPLTPQITDSRIYNGYTVFRWTYIRQEGWNASYGTSFFKGGQMVEFEGGVSMFGSQIATPSNRECPYVGVILLDEEQKDYAYNHFIPLNLETQEFLRNEDGELEHCSSISSNGNSHIHLLTVEKHKNSSFARVTQYYDYEANMYLPNPYRRGKTTVFDNEKGESLYHTTEDGIWFWAPGVIKQLENEPASADNNMSLIDKLTAAGYIAQRIYGVECVFATVDDAKRGRFTMANEWQGERLPALRESVGITANDIKKMVNESVKKIIANILQ